MQKGWAHNFRTCLDAERNKVKKTKNKGNVTCCLGEKKKNNNNKGNLMKCT